MFLGLEEFWVLVSKSRIAGRNKSYWEKPHLVKRRKRRGKRSFNLERVKGLQGPCRPVLHSLPRKLTDFRKGIGWGTLKRLNSW